MKKFLSIVFLISLIFNYIQYNENKKLSNKIIKENKLFHKVAKHGVKNGCLMASRMFCQEGISQCKKHCDGYIKRKEDFINHLIKLSKKEIDEEMNSTN